MFVKLNLLTLGHIMDAVKRIFQTDYNYKHNSRTS